MTLPLPPFLKAERANSWAAVGACQVVGRIYSALGSHEGLTDVIVTGRRRVPWPGALRLEHPTEGAMVCGHLSVCAVLRENLPSEPGPDSPQNQGVSVHSQCTRGGRRDATPGAQWSLLLFPFMTLRDLLPSPPRLPLNLLH